MNYYNKTLEEIYEELKTNEKGLSPNEATKRFHKYGANKIEEAKKKSKIRRFLEQFNDMMIIVLIVVAIFMALYGFLYSHDYTDTIVIVVIVLLNAIMGYVQEEKAEVTLESLKKYSHTKTKVKRNGQMLVIDSEKVVPGDVVLLETGDKVPADARLITVNNLQVDESPLTGESIPVKKINRLLKGKKELQARFNMVFSGSNVTGGSAEVVVVKTGMKTELGSIAESLNTPYEVETPLELKMKEISKKLTFLVFIIIVFMFFYGVLNDYETMEIIMLCVSLAVAVIPEGLPAVITVALSIGTSSLAKKKTVVRQMSAVETLGATDIICSDKTGTITQNKMQVKMVDINDVKMFNYISALANETIISDKKYIGDPTETCLFTYLKDNKIDPVKIREKYSRIISAPFDSERKMMSSVNKIDGKPYLLVKGSLENLLEHTSYIMKNGQKEKLTKVLKDNIKNNEYMMASKALRVIAFAYKPLKEIPKTTNQVIEEEDSLIYVGMAGMIDPPRRSVKASVKKCKKAGITPIMITGDSLVTGTAIAKMVGIIKDDSEGILGSELDKYSDKELKNIVKNYKLYARVSPKHKSRIVAALQANGKVVAMTGDGVNDAPAIKDAHVGIGMGITGTEVTKSVADVILLDDSFSTIVVAVEEGRRIFTNIRNNVVYSLSSNFAELFTVLIGMFTGHTILTPIQILFIDLVTDTIPSVCLSFEKAEKKVMEKPPRGLDKPIFTPFINSCIIYSAIVETILALVTYFMALKLYGAEVAATLALFTIVVQEILYALSCRNLKEFTYKQGLFSNKYMNIGLIIVLLIEFLVFLTPVGSVIGITPLSITSMIFLFLFNFIGLFLYEMGKPILKRLFKD